MTKAVVNHRNFFVTYFRLGNLLHYITIVEIALIYVCFSYFNLLDWVKEGNSFLKFFAICCLVFPPLFPQFDVRSRFQNYKQVKDYLFMYGFQPRIVKPFAQSKCQRDAVIAAAEELGFEKECRQYFYQLGYKWYHVFPDMLIKKPGYFFHKMFWLNTFFVKTYHSKIVFRKIVI